MSAEYAGRPHKDTPHFQWPPDQPFTEVASGPSFKRSRRRSLYGNNDEEVTRRTRGISVCSSKYPLLHVSIADGDSTALVADGQNAR